MEQVPIAALRPNLDALDSKQIKAVVTLIWPYSSSQRQFALLLAEPDFRLRRRNGQVRARFSSTSARALAATGVGIGDEVVLSLHGAQFVQHGAVSTPGKSIDWELVYTQTVAVSVRRDGAEIASLDFIDAAPTPAPRSPVKRPAAAPSPIPLWASPAFLKRARLSDGPFFEQPAYDPLVDESSDSHDKKRRRKSYRDWTAWKYTARTPSPDKDDVDLESALGDAPSSPSRPPQLPKTPISPSRTEPTSAAAAPAHDSDYVEETTIADSAEGDTTVDDGELQKVHVPLSISPRRPDIARDGAYGHLYDGPSEAPQESQYDFGGDTELNTEDEDEDGDDDVTVPDVEHVDASTTEAATEPEDGPGKEEDSSAAAASQPVLGVAGTVHLEAASAPQEDSDREVDQVDPLEDVSVDAEGTTIDETIPEVIEPAVVIDESIRAAMPPPSLPTLHTDFTMTTSADLLTPIGREPSSPNLRAVDSATLPLPSPFPGERDLSYFEHVSVHQQVPLDGPPAQEELEAVSDADYIMESSFFSSTSSSRAGGLHPDHETAFTPLRFTFGGDGAGWSRPLELSSPPPEETSIDAVAGEEDHISSPSPKLVAIETQEPKEAMTPEQSQVIQEARGPTLDQSPEVASTVPATSNETIMSRPDLAQSPAEASPAESAIADPTPKAPNVIHLSSDVESDHSELEDEAMAESEEEQPSEQESDPKSEDRTDASDEEQDSESEGNEANPEQIAVDDSRLYTGPDDSTDFGPEAGEQYYKDAFVGTQASAAVSEIVDLGSPSASESGGDEEQEVDVPSVQADHDVRAAASHDPSDESDLDVASMKKPGAGTAPEDSDNVISMEVIEERTTSASPFPEPTVRESASIAIPDAFEQPSGHSIAEWEPQLDVDKPSPFFEDHHLPDAQAVNTNAQVEIEYPDIKMESVEDDPLYLASQSESQDVPQQSATDLATEILISVPGNGNKIGELDSKSVPATAPARNTRSKAKSAASPPQEEAYVSRVSASTRRTRSKASFDSTDRDNTSPTQTRGRPRSTTSPVRDATPTSPYNLRSQSKQMSPANVASQPTPVRTSPRHVARRDADFDIVPSQAESRDVFGSMFEPSQELGFGYSQLSQRSYSGVGFVKDSEEGTSHSEASISTIQYSDHGEVVEAAQAAKPRLKPPPLSFSQTQHQTRSRSRSTGRQGMTVSPSQPQFSPRRSPRLTRSTFSATPSPRITRTARDLMQVGAIDAVDEQQRDRTQKSDQQSTLYPFLPSEGKDSRSLPPAAPDSAPQPPQHESNLLTPDDTQQTVLEPPVSFQARQPEQSLATPELTQVTSTTATLRSFDIALPGVQTQPAPPLSPVLRTSPRRKPATTNAQSSPTQQSSSALSSLISGPATATTTTPTQPPLPTIGLSTPIAYYTPLRDLPFFLNRSSQFHSGASPDILALVITGTTAPSRAKKGPRDYSTTLHITDASVYPDSRTVSVFRPHAAALPEAEQGDVVLLRAFAVHSVKGVAALRSGAESAWCVWRFGRRVWGRKKGVFGELRAREEVRGPEVERGEGEWGEVGRVRGWWTGWVRGEIERGSGEKEASG